MEKKKRVFISYKRKDEDIVFCLKEKIEISIGEKCWIDLDGIESDAQFVSVIIKAIKDCEVFLFMYSNHHNDIADYGKDWTIRELQYAENLNKKIVFINIDGSVLGDWFSFMFGQKQQVDGFSNESFARLLSDLRSWLKIRSHFDSCGKEEPILGLEERISYSEKVNNCESKESVSYDIDEILETFTISRRLRPSRYAIFLNEETYIKISWDELFDFVNNTLGYDISLYKLKTTNLESESWDGEFVSEMDIRFHLNMLLIKYQVKNDITTFSTSDEIDWSEIRENDIKWNALIQYFNEKYHKNFSTRQLFSDLPKITVSVDQLVDRISTMISGPIYPIKNNSYRRHGS